MATRKITTMELQMTGRSAQQFIQMMAQQAEQARKKMGELTLELNEVRKSAAYRSDDAATLKRAVALEKEIALLKEQASMYEAAAKSVVRNGNQMAHAMDNLSQMSLRQVRAALKEADVMLLNLGKDFEKDQAVLARWGQLVKELEARAKSLSKGVLQPVEQAQQALHNFGKSVGDIRNLSAVMTAQLPVFEKMSGGMEKWRQTIALTDKGYLTFGEDYLKVSTQVRQQLSMTDKASEQYRQLQSAFKAFGGQTLTGDITKEMRKGLEAALSVMEDGNRRAKAFSSAIHNIDTAGQTLEATFGKISGGNLFVRMNKELESMASRLEAMRAAGKTGTEEFGRLEAAIAKMQTATEKMRSGFVTKDAFSTLRQAMKEQETVIEANNKRYTEWKTLLADISSGAFPVEKVGQLTRALVEQSFMVQKDKDQWKAYSEVLGQVMSRSMTPDSLRAIITSLKAQLPALEENTARWREVNQLIADLSAREKMLTQTLGADMQRMSSLSVPALEAIRKELQGIINDGTASPEILAEAMQRMKAVSATSLGLQFTPSTDGVNRIRELAGANGLIQQLNDKTFPKTIEWLNKARQKVEEFMTKMMDTRDTQGLTMLQEKLMQIDQELKVVTGDAMSFNEAERQIGAILANMQGKRTPFSGTTQEIERVNQALKGLEQHYRKMGDKEGLQRVTQAMRGMKQAIDTSRISMQEFEQILKRPKSTRDVEKLSYVLNVVRERAKAAGAATAEQAMQMRNLDRQLKTVNQSFGYHASTMEQAASRLKSYVMIYMGFNALMMKARQAVSSNLQLADSISNIQKVSGGTEAEVQRLTNAIQRLDARTKNSELMQIAYQGGKMGIAFNGGMQAMEQFVEAANKLNSALGEDFGGAEAVGKLTKLTQTMGVAARDCHNLNEALERTGSAILTLGNNTTANYAYINGFATRLGGISRAANIAMPDLLAIGATMDVMGLQAEMSATAMTKFIATLSKQPEGLAQAIQLTGDGLTRFNEAIKSGDTMGAILEVFRHLKEGNADLKDMANVLKDMVGGGNNTRALQVLTAMAKNYDTLKANVDMANESFLEGTAIQKEYEIMNNNAAASAARLGNAIGEIFTNSKGVNVFASMFKRLADAFEYLEDHIPTLIGLIVSLFVTARLHVDHFRTRVITSLKSLTSLSGALKLVGSIGASAFRMLGSALRSVAIFALIEGVTYLIGKLVEARQEANRLGDAIKDGLAEMNVDNQKQGGALSKTVDDLRKVRQELKEAGEAVDDFNSKDTGGKKRTKEWLDTAKAMGKAAAEYEVQSKQSEYLKKEHEELLKAWEKEGGQIEAAVLARHKEAQETKEAARAQEEQNEKIARFNHLHSVIYDMLLKRFKAQELVNQGIIDEQGHIVDLGKAYDVLSIKMDALNMHRIGSELMAEEVSMGIKKISGLQKELEEYLEYGYSRMDEETRRRYMSDPRYGSPESISADIAQQLLARISSGQWKGIDASAVNGLKGLSYFRGFKGFWDLDNAGKNAGDAVMDMIGEAKKTIENVNRVRNSFDIFNVQADQLIAEGETETELELENKAGGTANEFDISPQIAKAIEDAVKDAQEAVKRLYGERQAVLDQHFRELSQTDEPMSVADFELLKTNIERDKQQSIEDVTKWIYSKLQEDPMLAVKGVFSDEVLNRWNEEAAKANNETMQDAIGQMRVLMEQASQNEQRAKNGIADWKTLGIVPKVRYNRNGEVSSREYVDEDNLRKLIAELVEKGNLSIADANMARSGRDAERTKRLLDELIKSRPFEQLRSEVQANLVGVGLFDQASEEEIAARTNRLFEAIQQAARVGSERVGEELRRSGLFEAWALDEHQQEIVLDRLTSFAEKYQDVVRQQAQKIKKRLEESLSLHGVQKSMERLAQMSVAEYQEFAATYFERQRAHYERQESAGWGGQVMGLTNSDTSTFMALQEQLRVARYEMDELQRRKRSDMAAIQGGTGTAEKKREALEAKMAEYKLVEVEKQKELNKLQLEELALREEMASKIYEHMQEYASIVNEFTHSLITAGSMTKGEIGMEEAKMRFREDRGGGLTRSEYVEYKTDGSYQTSWLTEREYMETQRKIDRQNAMADAATEAINRMGEKMSEDIMDAFQRSMNLRQVETNEEEQAQAEILEAVRMRIDSQIGQEQTFTELYKSELASRMEAFTQYISGIQSQMEQLVASGGQLNQQMVDAMVSHLTGAASLMTEAGASTMGAPMGETVGQTDRGNPLGLYMQEQNQAIMEGANATLEEYLQSVQATFGETFQITKTTDRKIEKDTAKMYQSMAQSMNLYGAAYAAVMNDNLTTTQKIAMFSLQAIGQMIMGLLSSALAQVGSDCATGLAGAIAKAFSQLGPVGGAAAIGGITAAIGAGLAVATKQIQKSKREVAAATGTSSGKLTTGMLTYASGRYLDEDDPSHHGMPTMSHGSYSPSGDGGAFHSGHSYSVDGTDGNRYSAKYEGAIKGTGIRKGTHFGIFSEVKPEMVIDGDTTALMHHKYPMLERAILQLHRTGTLNMGEMLGLNYARISKTIDTLSRSGSLSFPASRGTFRLPTFADGSYPYDDPSLTAAISSSVPPEYTPASSAEDIASRDRLSAAIEALIAHGVQAHMSTSEASKALAKRKRFEQRNGIRGGLGG